MAIGLYKAESLDESADENNSSDSRWSKEFEGLVHRELELIGEDPEREGLVKTPARVARAMKYFNKGYHSSAPKVVDKVVFNEEHDNIILMRDMELYSMCEHHMLKFFGKAHVAYNPNGK